MSVTVFCNGEFVDGSDPAGFRGLSVFDAGVQHGVGLFETMTGGVREGQAWVVHLDEHLERLGRSAKELGLSERLRERALGDAVVETVKRSGLERTRVRLTITGGDLNYLASAQHNIGEDGGEHSGEHSAQSAGGAVGDPTVLIVAQPATLYPAEMFERGVGVVFADTRANPLNPFEGHKTLNYWWRLRELQVAAGKRAGEALVLGVTNHVMGGCVSNVFLVKGGGRGSGGEAEIITPIARGEEEAVGGKGAIGSPVLPGVTRGWVIDVAERRGWTVTRRMISAADVLDADEVFLTNSGWGVLPVVKVEREAIGDGVVGKVAKVLAEQWGEIAR